MDPFSQGFVGAAFAQNFSRKLDIKKATICGAIGGILPDIDIFIRSSEDSLLAIQYHRHFTHSLIFIPVGGLVAALICMLLFYFARRNISFKLAYVFATLGYATHGLLDASTSYGTHLMWPFSDSRTSWSIISVVDLLYTIPVAILVFLAHRRMQPKYARFFLIFTFIYFSIGIFQNYRITQQMFKLANNRGHVVEHYEIKPTIGNNILWRSVYVSKDKIYIDSIRSNWLGDIMIYQGGELGIMRFPDDFSYFSSSSQQYYDIARFDLFSNSLIGVSPDFPGVLIDARYSSEANGTRPMWGLKYDPSDENKRAVFTNYRRDFNENRLEKFFSMLMGK